MFSFLLLFLFTNRPRLPLAPLGNGEKARQTNTNPDLDPRCEGNNQFRSHGGVMVHSENSGTTRKGHFKVKTVQAMQSQRRVLVPAMFCSCDADGGLFWGGKRFSHTYFHVEMRASLRSDSRKGRVCCGVCSGVWARDDGLSLSTGNATSNRSRRHALLCPAANEGVLHRGRCLRAASDCKYVPRYAWL